MARLIKKEWEEFKEKLEEKLKEPLPSPRVHYNSHTKKISVRYDFRFGTIPKVKIIGPREQWFEIYHGINQQTFDSIQDLIHSKRKKEELKQYAEENLERFRDDLLIYAAAAHRINPIQYFRNGKYYLYGRRKSSHYEFSRREKYEVARMAVRLYVYLRYNLSKKSPKQWPSYVGKFLDKYEISDARNHLKKDIALKYYVKDAMSKYFGIDSNERFWQTFIVESPIKLKRVRELKRINPEEDPFLTFP